MRRAGIAFFVCMMLAGCGGSGDEVTRGLSVRQLSDHEKQALASVLSQKLGDPGGTQFKWMPVLGTPVASSSWIPSISGAFSGSDKAKAVIYCGLLSERGGPFRIFSATIAPGSGGEYDHGVINDVDSSAPNAGAAGKPASGGAAAEHCRSAGYSDFALAQ